jgi:hypothetical protein
MVGNILARCAAMAALAFVVSSVLEPAAGSPIAVGSSSYELPTGVVLGVRARLATMFSSFDSAAFEKPSGHRVHWRIGVQPSDRNQRRRDVGQAFRYPYRVGDPELCEPSRWTFGIRGRSAHRPCWPHVWTCLPPERNLCFLQRP